MKGLNRKKLSTFDVVNTALVILITIIVAYPLYFCIIASFSEPKDVSLGRTLLWIKGFTLEAYKYILEERLLWVGYKNSLIYTFFGTIYNLVLTIPVAYALTKKWMFGRNAINWYFFITMYLSGGLIPTYLNMKNLGMLNNPLVLVVGAGVSAYNLIIARQYFATSIPDDVYEAAYIDGASEFQSFFKIALPLAKPIIAVLTLYYGVTHWNSYYNAMIYIRDQAYFPLQLVLRNILLAGQQIAIEAGADMEVALYLIRRAELVNSMKYGIILIASLPLLIAYPFVQKHFTKGIMIGSVKG